MVNAQTERMFGYSRNDLLGKPVQMLVPERYRRNHPGLRAGFLASPVSRPMGAGRDLFGLRKDGSEFPVEIGLSSIATEAGTMVLSAVVDISDRKQMEARSQTVNNMLAHINRVATVVEFQSRSPTRSTNRSRRWSLMPTQHCVGLRRRHPTSKTPLRP